MKTETSIFSKERRADLLGALWAVVLMGSLILAFIFGLFYSVN